MGDFFALYLPLFVICATTLYLRPPFPVQKALDSEGKTIAALK
jgi:hypothetical protein